MDVENNSSNSNEEHGPINPVIGIIYPPPEVRNIVDKTANFVARNGLEFEARIKENEIGNIKFNFLSPDDPYHSYYQHKVIEYREGKDSEPSSLSEGLTKSLGQLKQQEILNSLEQPFVPKEPPSEYEFIADPPSISALDLDIVKLTAQFVACKGKQFLTNLMNREQRNFQFDFLRPQHSLFQYFTKLLEQYTKVLVPPTTIKETLLEEGRGGKKILERVKYRASWEKYQEAQKAREEEILERERFSYAQIDWHDFVIVEVVDYQPFEIGNFPPPTTPEEVGSRILIQERLEVGEDIEMSLKSDGENHGDELSRMEDKTGGKDEIKFDNYGSQGKDDSSGDESEDTLDKQLEVKPVPPPIPDKVVVKKYDPKKSIKATRPQVGDDYLISPITGEKIPASKVQEHMRIGLLDPRWVEQRDKHITTKIIQDNVYAPGASINSSLKLLAERRTDIFGVGYEETTIGKKIGEEEQINEKITWDGHISSVEVATRAARAHVTLEDQIHQIHKVKGLLPDDEKEKIGPKNVSGISNTLPVIQEIQPIVMMPPPPLASMRPPPLLMPPPPPMVGFLPHHMGESMHNMKHLGDPMDEEPINKKIRNEDNLIPEAVFLSYNSDPVTIKITIPKVPEKSEWKLLGQTLSFTVDLSKNITYLKALIQNDTNMPPAKQKLFYDGMFFKDQHILAYYNLKSGAVIQLQIKERGGRKK